MPQDLPESSPHMSLVPSQLESGKMSQQDKEKPKARGENRGRPPVRQPKEGKKNNGQTTLHFRRDNSRSASSKRSRSKGHTPPENPDKQQRRQTGAVDDGTTSDDGDDHGDIAPS